jgi:hypothetical protein
MSGEALNSLQAAIYAALSNDTRLQALQAQVLDYAGPGVNFPYISIGDTTAIAFDTKTSNGQESTVVIHSWTQGFGRKSVQTIMGHVYRILHLANLQIQGQNLIEMRCEFEHSDVDPDGVTYHGVQRFRALTQEAL